MKRFFSPVTLLISLVLTLATGLAAPVTTTAQTATVQTAMATTSTQEDEWITMKGDVAFYMANDLGRNGYYKQKKIAELMGEMAGTVDPECVFAVGDIHHFNGVVSTADPLWMTNYEAVYSHPDLMTDWFPVMGNHEYRGSTQAVLDYAKVSRRWMMPARYYTRTFEHKGTTVRVIMLDTTPLIDKYRTDSETYPDAGKQDMAEQLAWLDNTLRQSTEDWVVVLGHHPIYAETNKSQSERTDMQQRVLPLLHKYHNVALYACGHIHNFQHIRATGDDIDYVVNSSASLARKVKPVEGTQYCSGEEGFSVISATKTTLKLFMIDSDGHILHTVSRNK